MSSTGNEAVAKAPTVEEEMSKFQGFAVKDGETIKPTATPAAAPVAADKKDNSAAATDTTATAKPELTADEEQDALQTATDKKGAVLTDEEADDVVAKALAAKEKAARKPQPDPDRARKAFDRREARRRDSLTRENEDLRRQLAARDTSALTKDAKGDKTVSQDNKPDHTDTAKYQYGELDPAYLADLSAWAAKAAIRQERESEKTQKQTEQDAEAANAHKARVAVFEEAGSDDFDDFKEVVMDNLANKANPDGWPCSQMLVEMILDSDHGPAVAYELASDIKEARRIYQLSPGKQAAWFARKEDELSAGSAKSTDNDAGKSANSKAEAGTKRQLPQPRNGQVRESKAPAPLSKLNGQGGNRLPSPATTDFAEFEALATGSKR